MNTGGWGWYSDCPAAFTFSAVVFLWLDWRTTVPCVGTAWRLVLWKNPSPPVRIRETRRNALFFKMIFEHIELHNYEVNIFEWVVLVSKSDLELNWNWISTKITVICWWFSFKSCHDFMIGFDSSICRVTYIYIYTWPIRLMWPNVTVIINDRLHWI